MRFNDSQGKLDDIVKSVLGLPKVRWTAKYTETEECIVCVIVFGRNDNNTMIECMNEHCVRVFGFFMGERECLRDRHLCICT